MPIKPEAIKLSSKTVQKISNEFDLPEREVENELHQPYSKVTFYYVKNPIYRGMEMNYLIYSEHDFLRDFASVPPGIEDRFVPVTQVSSKP